MCVLRPDHQKGNLNQIPNHVACEITIISYPTVPDHISKQLAKMCIFMKSFWVLCVECIYCRRLCCATPRACMLCWGPFRMGDGNFHFVLYVRWALLLPNAFCLLPLVWLFVCVDIIHFYSSDFARSTILRPCSTRSLNFLFKIKYRPISDCLSRMSRNE